MLSIWQDVRYGLRGMRSSPGFSALAMVTLALGIGAATTMFSVIENVLMAPFPYRDAEQIVAFDIHNLDDGHPGGRAGAESPAEYLAYPNAKPRLQRGYRRRQRRRTLDQRRRHGTVRRRYITPHTFLSLGVPALLGRTTTAEDGKPGAPAGLCDGYKMWQRRFHLDPSILGRTFVLNGKPSTLVGIMPKRFTKRGADLWQPVELDPADKTERFFVFQARLKPGVTFQQAEADLLPIAQRWAKDHPKDYPKRFTIEVPGYADSVVGPFKKTLYHAGRGGGAASVDCVRERGEHAAGAGHSARPRDGHPRCTGREPVARGCGSC